MINLWKVQVKLLLVLTAINIAVSCLVTNCPRGGKRGKTEVYIPVNGLVKPRIKKCKLCSPEKEICSVKPCFPDFYCQDEGICVNREVCCSKRLCKKHRICRNYFPLTKTKELKPTSIILTKILAFTMGSSRDLVDAYGHLL